MPPFAALSNSTACSLFLVDAVPVVHPYVHGVEYCVVHVLSNCDWPLGFHYEYCWGVVCDYRLGPVVVRASLRIASTCAFL